MKKLIFANCILGFALLFSYCSKPNLTQELGTETPDLSSSDRDKNNCCLQFVVTSGNFMSAEICGVVASANGCTPFTNSCGTSSGFWQTISNNTTFCVPNGQPFMITNTGREPITFYLAAQGGNSGSACLTPYSSISFEYDCRNPVAFCAP